MQIYVQPFGFANFFYNFFSFTFYLSKCLNGACRRTRIANGLGAWRRGGFLAQKYNRRTEVEFCTFDQAKLCSPLLAILCCVFGFLSVCWVSVHLACPGALAEWLLNVLAKCVRDLLMVVYSVVSKVYRK